MPTSDLSADANIGFNGLATLAFMPASSPLGFRVDGAYTQMGVKGGGANLSFTSLTGNLVLGIPSAAAKPYIIGGAGLYRTAANVTGYGSASENDFGFNAGAGVAFPLASLQGFIEARYNRVSISGSSVSFVPVTLGIMF